MKMLLRQGVLLFWLAVFLTVGEQAQSAAKTVWASAATGADLTYEIFTPPNANGDEKQQVADLLAANYLVMSLDYARRASAVTPDINADVLKVRKEIPALLEKYKPDEDRIFLLPVGWRIVQDVEYYRQDGRSYRFDARFPANPKLPVPLVMQISHDNLDRRRNAPFVQFNDTLLEGAMLRGYAVALVEHIGAGAPAGHTPVMPDYIYKLKSAVRTLRANARKFNLDADKIAALGFSKGGIAAAMLATMGGSKELEGDGLHREFSSRVAAAVCLAGRYSLCNWFCFDFSDFISRICLSSLRLLRIMSPDSSESSPRKSNFTGSASRRAPSINAPSKVILDSDLRPPKITLGCRRGSSNAPWSMTARFCCCSYCASAF